MSRARSALNLALRAEQAVQFRPERFVTFVPFVFQSPFFFSQLPAFKDGSNSPRPHVVVGVVGAMKHGVREIRARALTHLAPKRTAAPL